MLRFLRELLAGLMPEGIRQRLFLLITLVLVPLVLLLAWIYYQSFYVRRDTEFRTQLENAEFVAANLKTYVESIHKQSFITGQAIINMDVYTREKAENLLVKATDQYEGIRNMSWVSVDGTVLASSVGLAGESLSYRSYFQKAIKSRNWAVGDLTQTGTVTLTPTVALATAIEDNQGFLRGLVVTAIEPRLMSEAISVKNATPDTIYVVFDSKGVVVFSCPEIPMNWAQRTGWIKGDRLLRETLRTNQSQMGPTWLDLIDEEDRLSARAPIPELGWVAGAGRSARLVFHLIWRNLLWDSIVAACVIAAAFALAYLFSRTISVPILRLQAETLKMGHGQIIRRTEPYAPYEVQNLREQIEALAGNLITRAGQLADATNDLKAKNAELESIISITSHDLKSPVVNIMGFSGELARSLGALKNRLMEHGGDCQTSDIMAVLDTEIPEEMDFIRKNTRSIDQMLQSLAKVVHVVLSEIRPTRVKVSELIASLLPQFSESIHRAGVDLRVEPLPDCHADPVLLKEIFFNLIENAILCLDPKRPGKIVIGGSVGDTQAVYFVKDNGRGIAPGHQENIFKLFHKLDVSLEGEGIGLTVSKRLIERQSGNLWVQSQLGEGSTFFLALPKA
ncbi:MAG: hypothetical protein LLF76_06110 [Planctomycetaceae bacterium]|nr:hypothetical protein [Planctomycetaceae bacterium]